MVFTILPIFTKTSCFLQQGKRGLRCIQKVCTCLYVFFILLPCVAFLSGWGVSEWNITVLRLYGLVTIYRSLCITVIYGRPVTSIYSYTGYPIKYSLICAARCILFFITIITTNGRRYIFTTCCCGCNTCTGIIGNGSRYRITTCCGRNTCTVIITNGSRYIYATYYKYTIATYIFILNIPTKPYYIPIQHPVII
uniref:PI196L n=1 Tax=African swine fever virus TaxID=10497 RepID=A0A6G7KTW6_ASF